MQKQFVTYEIALKFKELGYDDPCFKVYDEKGFLQDEDVMDKLKLIKVLAPLWQDVIDWFREEHNIHIWIYYDMILENSYYQIRHEVNKSSYHHYTNENAYHNMHEIDYPTSREHAILKAIEIIKKK